MSRQHRWKLLLPLLMILSLVVSFWTPQSAAAADGVNVSTITKTYAIASGVSFDGQRVCVVWSRFDEDPQAFIRVLNVTANTWSPALGSDPFQLSSGGFGGVESTKCAFDTAGTLHAVWQQKESGSFSIVHRSLPNGGDPSNAGSWSAVATVDGDGDGSDISAFQPDNAGRVWLVHRKYKGDSGSQLYLRSRQNGSWSAPAIFTASGAAGSPRVAVDNLGYVHLAWKNGNSGRGYAFYNSNNGTFSSEVGIPNSGGAGNFSMTVNRDNGDVHTLFSKNFSELHYAKKTGAGSTTFGSDAIIATADNRALDPQITWSPARLIVVFDSGDKARIDTITSTDQGGSWSSPATLAAPSGGAQSPWVVADSLGNGYVAYAHKSDGTVYFTTMPYASIPVAERCAGFADVRNTNTACTAIEYLSRLNVVNGYNTNPPTFGPTNPVLRAQMSAFIVRGLNWGSKPTGPKTFNDFGPLVGELRTASLILANACNSQAVCVAQGYGNGNFGPNDSVTYAQVISFIARAFDQDAKYDWTAQPTGVQPYTGVPAVHDIDVRTYTHYAGRIANVTVPANSTEWNLPAPRAWVAQVLYQALLSNVAP